MNFQELLNSKEYTQICIPRLQRDYAHGRVSRKVEDIRHDFLKDIFSGKPLSLNMVFGDVDDKTLPREKRFIPIDGQQRLTTLYLLHIYAHKCVDGINIENLKKFCYETRQSSNDFVKALLSEKWPTPVGEETLGDAIKNCHWFWWTWNSDPTVSGMLTMLSDIYRSHQHTKTFPNLDSITFDFQDLKENNLNETLYIKMNSRGLPLTEFEQIKCGMEEEISKIDDFKNVNKNANAYFPEDLKLTRFDQKWSWQMDRSWSEWFWNCEPHTLDRNILWFIVEYTCCFCACWMDAKNKSLIGQIEDFRKRFEEEEATWHSLKSMFESDLDGFSNYKDLMTKFFIGLASLFNRIIKLSELKTSWGETYQFKSKDPKQEKKQSVMLFAISCYEGHFEGDAFNEWFRFCANIIQHYDTSGEGFVSLCRAFGHEYSCYSTDILNWLSKKELEGQRNEQFIEECKKASLMKNVETDVRSAEAHPLFKGRIRQLLVDANGEYTGEFSDKKWKSIKKYFTDKGEVRDDFQSSFSKAFLRCLNKKNQIFDGQYILNHTYAETAERLKQKRYIKAYHLCLDADELSKVAPLSWSEDEEKEFGQYREKILENGVIDAIVKCAPKPVNIMRFKLFGNCWFFYPYNSKSIDWYIGFDRKEDGETESSWDRSRNQITKQLIAEKNASISQAQVASADLWWGQTFKYALPEDGLYFDWDSNYNVHLLNEGGERIKKPNKNEEYCFSAVGLSYDDFLKKIQDLHEEYNKDLREL